MTTINISLPDKLKKQADRLVSDGTYSSFSDLVRTGLRKLFWEYELDMAFEKTKRDYLSGRANVLENKQDIDNYLERLRNNGEDNNVRKIRSGNRKISPQSKIV